MLCNIEQTAHVPQIYPSYNHKEIRAQLRAKEELWIFGR
jgi:hypothetical protein